MIAKLLYLISAVALVQAVPPAIDEEVLPNGCPADWQVYKYLPHETDSTQFYHCINGERIQRPCPVGTFNADLQMCEDGEVDVARNSGQNNSGNSNSGSHNSGSFNSGNYNTGDRNSGNGNTGNNNSGHNCSSNNNRGSNNSGNYN